MTSKVVSPYSRSLQSLTSWLEPKIEICTALAWLSKKLQDVITENYQMQNLKGIIHLCGNVVLKLAVLCFYLNAVVLSRYSFFRARALLQTQSVALTLHISFQLFWVGAGPSQMHCLNILPCVNCFF